MASVKVLLNKSRIRADKTYPVVFQIISGNRKKLIYSKRYLYEDDFDSLTGRVVRRRGRRSAVLSEIDEYIATTYADLKKVISELERRGVRFSVDDIVSGSGSKQKKTSVLNYMSHLTHFFKDSGKDNTACSYKSTYNRVAGYLNHNQEFSFLDITAHWLEQFVAFLNSEGLCTSTIGFYIRVFSSVYQKAIDDELFQPSYRSPFVNVKIPIQKTVKRAISADMIATIAQADLTLEPKLDFARDIFMISFYSMGMSFVDIAKLKRSDVKDTCFSYIRSKTGALISVEIQEPLKAIFLKYQSDSEYAFPIISSNLKSNFTQYRSSLRRTNQRLAELSIYLNFPDGLTTYVARHSWATIAKELGIPLTVISESLGHTSEKTTMIYLKELDKSVLHQANSLVCCRVVSQSELSE